MTIRWTIREYAEVTGMITIQWNYVERAVNSVGWSYLGGDIDVASHIFNGLKNVSKGEFIIYLAEKYENRSTDPQPC